MYDLMKDMSVKTEMIANELSIQLFETKINTQRYYTRN